jgi:uncharacterized protein YbaR (Trm112 family)
MVAQELLAVLNCPVCVREGKGALTLHKNDWLVCKNCGRKYPIVEDIPMMLIDIGDKWIQTPEAQLPIPAPEN